MSHTTQAVAATKKEHNPPGQWRLLWPATFCWLVATFAVAEPGTGRRIVWLTGFICLGLIISMIWARHTPKLRKILSYFALSSAALLLVSSRIDMIEHSRTSPEFETLAETQEIITLDVVLTSFPEKSMSSFHEESSWATARAAGSQGNVSLVLWFRTAAHDEWAPRTGLQVRGAFQELDSGSPQAFGFSVHEVVIPNDLAETEKPLSITFTAKLRTILRVTAASVPGAELVPGFAVGDTSLVSEELSEQMRASSLTHLVAVSGANCALITSSVMYLASLLGAGRRTRLLLATVALGGFVTVVGPDPSVQRAAIMAAVMLVSGFGGKKAVALASLGCAMLLLLCIDPWQSRHPGFALSVAATGGILLMVPQIEKWARARSSLPRWLILPIAIACAAQLACGPILILLQPGIPAVGILANVLAAPAAPLGTGLGLLAMILLTTIPSLGVSVLWIASIPARWIAATAEVTSALPMARWHWVEGVQGALLLAGCETALIFAILVHRGVIGVPGGARALQREPWMPESKTPRLVQTTRAVLLCVGIGVFLAASIVAPTTERILTPSHWNVVACDVGQGDALLLRDPKYPKEVMLVDTGDDAELLRECLSQFGVKRISLLVLSHDDRDHVGAMSSILHLVDAALISPPVVGEEHDYRPVAAALEHAGVPVTMGVSGMYGALLQGSEKNVDTFTNGADSLAWQILAPDADYRPSAANAASLVMIVQAGSVRVLLLGDTGRDEHLFLLRKPQTLRADVVKVTHHGSKDQDSRVLLHASAELALFSVGADNRYGHPTSEALSAAASAGSQALRTDIHGSIAIIEKHDALRVWVERE